MDKDLIVSSIRSIPDFPKEGILFRDVTTLFGNAEAFREVVDAMYELYKDKGITKVCGLESRGFIAGAALAYRLGAGFVTIRKPGKLPCETYSEEYMKEYGKDTLEIHTDALTSDDVVLLHDDLLATDLRPPRFILHILRIFLSTHFIKTNLCLKKPFLLPL